MNKIIFHRLDYKKQNKKDIKIQWIQCKKHTAFEKTWDLRKNKLKRSVVEAEVKV